MASEKTLLIVGGIAALGVVAYLAYQSSLNNAALANATTTSGGSPSTLETLLSSLPTASGLASIGSSLAGGIFAGGGSSSNDPGFVSGSALNDPGLSDDTDSEDNDAGLEDDGFNDDTD